MAYSKYLAQEIQALFTQAGFLFECAPQADGMVYRSSFLLGEDAAIPKITLLISLQEQEVLIRAYSDLLCDPSLLAPMGEYLHRANFGMTRGSFELDCDSGSIYFKVFLDGAPHRLTPAQLQQAVMLCGNTWRRYAAGMVQLLSGPADPKELIARAEQ